MLTLIIKPFLKSIYKEMLKMCLCKGPSKMKVMNSATNMFGGINTNYYENNSKK